MFDRETPMTHYKNYVGLKFARTNTPDEFGVYNFLLSRFFYSAVFSFLSSVLNLVKAVIFFSYSP